MQSCTLCTTWGQYPDIRYCPCTKLEPLNKFVTACHETLEENVLILSALNSAAPAVLTCELLQLAAQRLLGKIYQGNVLDRCMEEVMCVFWNISQDTPFPRTHKKYITKLIPKSIYDRTISHSKHPKAPLECGLWKALLLNSAASKSLLNTPWHSEIPPSTPTLHLCSL